MTITEATEAFSAHLIESGKRPNTVAAYLNDARQLAAIAAEGGIESPAELTAEYMAGYFEGLGVSPSTHNRKLAALLMFFEFMRRSRLVVTNPVAGMERRNMARLHTRDVASDEAIRRVVEHAEHGSRDRAVLELMAMGISPQEVAGLKVSDFDACEGVITVPGARAGRRQVVLSAAALCAVEAYRAGHIPHADKARPLFQNRSGLAFSRQGIWKIALWHCPVGVRLSARDLKRARTVALLAQGVDRKTVAHQMGHTHLTTTQQYERIAHARTVA